MHPPDHAQLMARAPAFGFLAKRKARKTQKNGTTKNTNYTKEKNKGFFKQSLFSCFWCISWLNNDPSRRCELQRKPCDKTLILNAVTLLKGLKYKFSVFSMNSVVCPDPNIIETKRNLPLSYKHEQLILY
jgi:hypothetical protein